MRLPRRQNAVKKIASKCDMFFVLGVEIPLIQSG